MTDNDNDNGDGNGNGNSRARLLLDSWSGLVIALAAYLVVTVGGVLVRSPLGHDEGVYALRSRDLGVSWEPISGGYWADYRAPGLPMMLAVTNRILGMHVVTLRLTVVALGAVILVVTFLIARHLDLGRSAGVAPFLIAIVAGFGYTSSTVLADVPGAAFAIIAVFSYLIDVDRGVLRWSMIIVPVATVWATVARFGAPFMAGAGLVAAFLVAAPAIWRARNWVVVAQSTCVAFSTALGLWLVLFTDLLSFSHASPAEANSGLIEGKGLTPSSGFADLKIVLNPWSAWPVPLWSKVACVVFVAGLVLGLIGALTGRGHRRAVVFGLISGIISLVGVVASVGLVVANYLALSLPFWSIVAASGYGWIASEFAAVTGSRRWIPMVAGVVVAGLAASLVVKTTLDTRYFQRRQEVSFATLRDVSVDAGRTLGDDCLLVTGYAPQVGYYSGCRIVGFRGYDSGLPLPEILRNSIRIAEVGLSDGRFKVDPPVRPDATGVLIREGGKRQPPNEQLLTLDGLGPRFSEVGIDGQTGFHVWSSVVLPCVFTSSCPVTEVSLPE